MRVHEHIEAPEHASAPATPPAGRAQWYPRTDGRFYTKDDAGVERRLAVDDDFLPSSADGVRYVSAGALASDSNDGLTPQKPKATVAAAIASLPAGGGVVRVGAGTFVGQVTMKSHVVVEGLGPELTVLTVANGADVDVVRGENFGTLTGTNGNGGIVRWGLRNLTVDGNKANQTSAVCGLRVYGYNFTVDNVVVRNCKGWGVWSEWAAGNFEILGDGSEAELNNFKVHDNEGGGIAWRGPHDSVWKSGIVFLNGTVASPQVGVDIAAGASGLHCYAVHVWGADKHSWCWYLHNTGTGDATTIALVDCIGEGGESGQLIIGDNDCSVIGGSYFDLGSAATPKGITIGDGAAVEGTVILGAKVLNCTSGAITYANDAGSTVVLDVYQAGGTVEVGAPAASSRIDIRGNGARAKFPASVEATAGFSMPAGQALTSGTTDPVSLYRNAANQWRTDDSLVIVNAATNALEVWGAVQTLGVDTVNEVTALLNGAQLRGYSDQFSTLKFLVDAANGNAQFTALAASTATVAQGAGAGLGIDLTLAGTFQVTVSGNMTSGNPLQFPIKAGQVVTVQFAQDATGGRTILLPTRADGAAVNWSGSAPVPPTAALARFSVTLFWDGTDWWEVGRSTSVGQDPIEEKNRLFVHRDSFNRADGAPGTLDFPKSRSWTVEPAGSWVISGNRLTCSAADVYAKCMFEAFSPIGRTKFRVASVGAGEWYYTFNHYQTNDHYRVGWGGSGNYKFEVIVNNVAYPQTALSTPPAPANGDVVEVYRLSNDGVEVLVNGTLYWTIGEDFLLPWPWMGFAAYRAGSAPTVAFDDFEFTPYDGLRLKDDPLWQAKGDLAVGLATEGTANVPSYRGERLAVGTRANQVLQVDSAQTTGLKWGVALTVGGTAPASPAVGDLWVDTT